EHAETTIYSGQPPGSVDSNKKTKEIAGTAEFLRLLPKPFATLKGVDPKDRTVTLLIDSETAEKPWPVEPAAEIKVGGWWGRLEQFKPDQRVWVWLKLDRAKKPVSVVMLADECSEFDMHGGLRRQTSGNPKFTAEEIEARRRIQRAWLAKQWTEK